MNYFKDDIVIIKDTLIVDRSTSAYPSFPKDEVEEVRRILAGAYDDDIIEEKQSMRK